MTPSHRMIRSVRRPLKGLALGAALFGVAACTTSGTQPFEGIGFREARFEEVSAMRDYRKCRDQALELDRQARTSGSTGQYLTSAQILEKCEAELGPNGNGIAVEERMRAYALSVQNNIKGGDVEQAQKNLQRFKAAFPKNDLYYSDGSSFIATMETLLGQVEPWRYDEYAALNVNGAFKSEMRRIQYWKRK